MYILAWLYIDHRPCVSGHGSHRSREIIRSLLRFAFEGISLARITTGRILSHSSQRRPIVRNFSPRRGGERRRSAFEHAIELDREKGTTLSRRFFPLTESIWGIKEKMRVTWRDSIVALILAVVVNTPCKWLTTWVQRDPFSFLSPRRISFVSLANITIPRILNTRANLARSHYFGADIINAKRSRSSCKPPSAAN